MPFQLLNSLFVSEPVRQGMQERGMLAPPDPLVALAAFLGCVVVASVVAGVLLRTRDV